MVPLIVGTVLALGALAYVLWPVVAAAEGHFRGPRESGLQRPMSDDVHGEAVAALREIEFDHATGKLSEADYAALKSQYTSDAVAALRARERVDDDPVEAEIRRARAMTRVCPRCGPRPEPAARYCSRCGAEVA